VHTGQWPVSAPLLNGVFMNDLNLINSMYVNYSNWLLASELSLGLDDTSDVLKSLKEVKVAINNAFILDNEENALLLYEAIVEHLHAIDLHWDDAPDRFQDLYDAIDQYRVERPLKLSD